MSLLVKESLITEIHTVLVNNDARELVKEYLLIHPNIFHNECFNVIAIGKAAVSMYFGLQSLAARIDKALIIFPEGYSLDIERKLDNDWKAIANSLPVPKLIVSSHPVPDKRSLIAGKKLVQFIQSQPTPKNWLILMSGGSSALVEVLKEQHGLTEIFRLNELMLRHALPIEVMNDLRKRFSKIKNGGLLNYFPENSSLLQLMLSDVAGDDPSLVGSGLLFPKPINLKTDLLPNEVLKCLTNVQLNRKEDEASERLLCQSQCIGNSLQLCEAIAGMFKLNGHTEINIVEIDESVASYVGRIHSLIKKSVKGVYLFHGETYLDLPEDTGIGGRNLHSALLVAQIIRNYSKPIQFVTIASDGFDGNSGAAGAYVDNQTWQKLIDKGCDPVLLLTEFNSYTGLEAIDSIIDWAPGRTNVRDIGILLIE
ncbi:DUF4147 domain-containing protein [Pleionea sediminis]|uniref:DUF4147 domain-containing protein n=1 Tax=Pleionea sediminis TaxID=2569479 RepID=UPI0011872DA6|nr:DUF4147 domain-containing protein [Pleionea sediminis]